MQDAVANRSPQRGQGNTRALSFHAYTIWLFTCNDILSIVVPETMFGLVSALSGSALTTDEHPDVAAILQRLPLVLCWNWLNVLLFDVANQRLASSIVEDAGNKAWRPLPSGRLTPLSARRLLLALVAVVPAVAWLLGGMSETVIMVGLTWMYNDLAGADDHWAIRNLINAAGFVCYSAGATRVALGFAGHALHPEKAPRWLGIIGAVVLTTLQLQDLPDVEGDRARGRRTLPLTAGDRIARWSIAVPVVTWSVVCPLFWQLSWHGYLLCGVLGICIAWRVLRYKTLDADKLTWRIWCAWTISLYCLPLYKRI